MHNSNNIYMKMYIVKDLTEWEGYIYMEFRIYDEKDKLFYVRGEG